MSFTFVQNGSATSNIIATSLSVTLTGVSTGDLVTVSVFADNVSTSSYPSLTISDSQSNTWTSQVTNSFEAISGHFSTISIYSSVITTGGTVDVTIASNVIAFILMDVIEWSAPGGTLAVDTTTTGASITLTTTPIMSAMTLHSTDLVISAFGIDNSNITATAQSGYTIAYQHSGISVSFIDQYNSAESNISVSPTITLNIQSAWNGCAVAFSLGVTRTFVFDIDSSLALEPTSLNLTSMVQDVAIPIESMSLISSCFSDLSTGLENQYVVINSGDVFTSDSSIATDISLVTNFIYLFDSSSSSDQSTVLNSIIQIERPATSDTFTVILFILNIDTATSLESQQTHNVLLSYDSDAGFGSESQLTIGQFSFSADASTDSESQYSTILYGDIGTGLDRQTLVNSIRLSTDQVGTIENQLLSISGVSVVAVFDVNPTMGVEASLRTLFSAESSIAKENSLLSISIISPFTTESSTAHESALPILLSSESPLAIDSYLNSTLFISIESPIASESFTFFNLILQADSSLAKEVQILFTSFIDVGLAPVDSATGNESSLLIHGSSDFGLSDQDQIDHNSTIIIIGSYTTESPIVSDNQLKFIFNSELPKAVESYILSVSLVQASPATIDSAIGNETQLPICMSSESPISIDQNIRYMFSSNPGFAIDAQFLSTSAISTGSGVTDSGIAGDAAQLSRLAGDFGYGFDSQFTFVVPPPLPGPVEVLSSIQQYIQSTNLFGPNSVELVIDPDSKANWPIGPGAICLIEPLAISDVGDAKGGGRFSKLWQWDLNIHIIVNNIYDQSFKDIIIFTSTNDQTGPYQIASLFSRIFEQAYITNAIGQSTLIEFPFLETTEGPKRYKQANSYMGLVLKFRVLFLETLPANLPYLFNNIDVTPQMQWNDYPDLFSSIATVINSSGVFSPTLVDFVAANDSEYKWPTSPSPFALIETDTFTSSEEGIGGGRYSHVYTTRFKLHVIINNILDTSWRDSFLTSSQDPMLGAYKLVDQVINMVEQSWPIDINNIISVIELPYAERVDPPSRYKGSNSYSCITIHFYVKWCQNMDNTNFLDAMPN